MNKFKLTLMALILILPSVSFAEKAPKKIVDLAHSTLAAMGSDPVIVDAVKQENAKGKTLDQVKKTDETWKATAGISDSMKAIMDSECGKHVRSIQAQKPFYAEIFVMDNLGGNVAMTDKTSDYWQGDEAKFINSFNKGAGAVFIDDVEFDESSQSYLVQVSVPVKDGDKAIGAITFGIDVDKVN